MQIDQLKQKYNVLKNRLLSYSDKVNSKEFNFAKLEFNNFIDFLIRNEIWIHND